MDGTGPAGLTFSHSPASVTSECRQPRTGRPGVAAGGSVHLPPPPPTPGPPGGLLTGTTRDGRGSSRSRAAGPRAGGRAELRGGRRLGSRRAPRRSELGAAGSRLQGRRPKALRNNTPPTPTPRAFVIFSCLKLQISKTNLLKWGLPSKLQNILKNQPNGAHAASRTRVSLQI